MSTRENIVAWLETHPGEDPPEHLDLALLGQVYGERPELVPPPQLAFGEILADVKSGPLAPRRRRWVPVAVLALAAAAVLAVVAWQSSGSAVVATTVLSAPRLIAPATSTAFVEPERTDGHAAARAHRTVAAPSPAPAEMDALRQLGYAGDELEAAVELDAMSTY